MGDVTGLTEYQHDAVGREWAIPNPTGHRLTYGFDAVWNRVWMDAPNGRTSYAYDPEDRCALIHNPYDLAKERPRPTSPPASGTPRTR